MSAIQLADVRAELIAALESMIAKMERHLAKHPDSAIRPHIGEMQRKLDRLKAAPRRSRQ